MRALGGRFYMLSVQRNGGTERKGGIEVGPGSFLGVVPV